ncbi:MAG: hypothetical protein H6925_05145 [Holosporaceae bacterium]|nr:MAG: hypothetical protein H6925_05145 [Holosporaceae bacterium]
MSRPPTSAPAAPTEAQKKSANATLRKFLQRRRQFKVAAAPKSLHEIAQNTPLVADELSPGIVGRWLEKANLINKRILATPKCLQVEETKGGTFTEKIFYVFTTPTTATTACPKSFFFVVKALKAKSAETELKNLQLLQQSPQLRTLSSLRDPNYPQITFSENFYRYQNSAGESHYLLLIHAARGQSLQQIFKTGDSNLQIKAFTAFGHTLGNFNKRFLGENCLLTGGQRLKTCRTINHGDLHPNNVFYDGKYIYFIDTETLARSIRDLTPLFIDILYFYNLPVYYWHADQRKFKYLYAFALGAYLNALTPSKSTQQKMISFLESRTHSKEVAVGFIKKWYTSSVAHKLL